jgi:DNA mismatch repair protein MutL
MPIRRLPPEVASQIAAGEVVERPASVVKELLENALDAGAARIAITVEDGGKRLIEVADDGQGIPAAELPLAIERHATSKLASAADLTHIASLGFRGEALASIGSISRLTLTSAQEGSPAARIRVEGGRGAAPEACGAPRGTVVRVEDLFHNVPARLKFLKTDRTERARIAELVTRYALAYPRVRFTLILEGDPALQTSGSGDAREVLAKLYDPDTARRMIEVDAAYEGFAISGYISPVALTRSNRREINFFVNGRWVQDSALAAALIQAYHTQLMVGRYPLAALKLEIDPEEVDVNVHPAKAEVRFRDHGRVFADVQRSVRRALLAHAPLPGMEHQPQYRWTPPAAGAPPHEAEAAPRWGNTPAPGDAALPFTQPRPADVPDQRALPEEGRVPLLRLVGQIASAFLVAEGPDGLYLIDQHAAHERVLFEKFMAQRAGSIPSQQLLEPAVVELPPHLSGILEAQLPALGRLGFEVESFGHDAYIIRGIPALLAGMSPQAALRVLVEDFEEDETPLQDEIEAKIVARVCKRAAVKAGQLLSPHEQQGLVRDLEASASPRTCPHGRPTMIHLSVDLLERQFGRRGAR